MGIPSSQVVKWEQKKGLRKEQPSFLLQCQQKEAVFLRMLLSIQSGDDDGGMRAFFFFSAASFSTLFSCETKTGSRFINVILRGVNSELQMPVSFQHHHESLILTHLYSASILSFLPRYSGNETTTRGSALTLSTKLPSHKNSKVYL